MVLGEKIKYYRELNNLTQDELAKLSGLSKNSIYNYENNKREPSIYNTSKIADALNIDINKLMSDNEIVTLPKKSKSYENALKQQRAMIQKITSNQQGFKIPPELKQTMEIYSNLGKQFNEMISKLPNYTMLDKTIELENNDYDNTPDSEQFADEDENNKSDLISEINNYLESLDEDLLKNLLVIVKKMNK